MAGGYCIPMLVIYSDFRQLMWEKSKDDRLAYAYYCAFKTGKEVWLKQKALLPVTAILNVLALIQTV